ncbi:MAG: hypothetical protein LLF90_08780 [Methanomicrobiaceae archaeon]|uniref:hypothetical protein n=1 Tax=Methanoculleus sp. TaxID=90427 RepID=UPI003210FA78|nr:hypothetical protein [Methanomicrobiaceae archaeon]
MRRTLWILILLIALIGTASAIPALPAEFTGSVTIDGSPAPAGTVITARIGDRDCGSLTLTAAGAFGGDSTFDKRLLVGGEDGDAGKTITFFVDGVRAAETVVYAPGTPTILALTVTGGGTSGTSSGSSGGGAPAGPITTPAPVTEFTGSGTLDTDTEGAVRFTTVITAAEGDASLTIGRGVRALDRSGAPLGSVNVEIVPPGDLPGTGDTSEPVGRAVRCGPAGATFDPAVRVSFTLTPEEWERYEGGQFVVRWYSSGAGAWEPLATTVHPSTRTVSAAVPHFTLVAVFAVPVEEVPAPAATTAPLTDPTLTFGPVVSATAVQQAGLPFSWFAGFAALAGAALLARKRG